MVVLGCLFAVEAFTNLPVMADLYPPAFPATDWRTVVRG
jgi:hypothetical protein